MSEERKVHETSPEMEFEHQDLSPHGVYGFLTGLAVGVILVSFILWGLYHIMEGYERSHQPPQNPLVQAAAPEAAQTLAETIQKFPQPRLEKNERLEINDFLLKEEDTLDSYGWVDQKAGVVRIPIERAMQLIAQQGLPTTPKVGAVPPAEVNVANQAAPSVDTSNIKKKGKK
jgi:hypothetical protein